MKSSIKIAEHSLGNSTLIDVKLMFLIKRIIKFFNSNK